MKKVAVLFSLLLFLTSCASKRQETPNEILLKIKDYSCDMQINFFSNKNSTSYLAKQTYTSDGTYSLEFMDTNNLKINYKANNLSISSVPLSITSVLQNYENLNSNPLFLSYFINTYFNSEENNILDINKDEILIKLPNKNPYLYTAKLAFSNNTPSSLTYFDKNGTAKVNIIYNEFISRSS